jgi:hypothetical protein
MRHTLLRLAVVAALTVGSAAATVGTAAAKPGGVPADAAITHANGKSVLSYCGTDADAHPGQHNGWDKQAAGGERRRNVGGACPV